MDKTVVINEKQAATVRWLAEQYAAGITVHSLVCQLNERGTPAEIRTCLRNHVNGGFSCCAPRASLAYQLDSSLSSLLLGSNDTVYSDLC